MAKIGIDCDGVLANFIKAFADEANHIWPGRVPKGYVQTRWDDIAGLTSDEIDQVWKRARATENWWMKLDAYSANVAALMTFLYATKGHDIYIVTSRVPTAGASVAFQTDVWLRACGVFPHSNYLAVLPVEHWHDKRHIYKHGGFDFSIDDKGETVAACDTLEEHTAFLLDQPWNQEFRPKNRVTDMKKFFNAIAPNWL
jgi:hypothetical protein